MLALLGLCGAESDVDVAVLRAANEATDHLLSSTSALLVAFLDFNEKFPYNYTRYTFDLTPEWQREGEGRESNNYGSSSSGYGSGSGQESSSSSRIERQLALMRANMTLPGGLCEEAKFYLDSVVSDREVRGVEGARAVLRTVRGLVGGVRPIGEASARVVQALSVTVENGAAGMVWYTPTIGEVLKVAGKNGESLWDDCGLCGWPRSSLQPSMCARENPREHPEIVFQYKLGQLRSGSILSPHDNRPLTSQLTASLGAFVSLKDSLRAIERTLAVAAPLPVPSDGGPGSGPQAASAPAAAPTSAPSDGGQSSQVPVPHSRAPSSTPATESSKTDGSRTSGSSGAGLWLGLLLVVVLLFVGGVYLLRLRNQAHFGAVINGATV